MKIITFGVCFLITSLSLREVLNDILCTLEGHTGPKISDSSQITLQHLNQYSIGHQTW